MAGEGGGWREKTQRKPAQPTLGFICVGRTAVVLPAPYHFDCGFVVSWTVPCFSAQSLGLWVDVIFI